MARSIMTEDINDDMLKAAKANCEALLNGLLSFELNLVRFSDEKCTEPCGLATGFIVQKGERHYLLSAGHAMSKPVQWYWETNVVSIERRDTLCIPIGPFTLLKSYVIDDEGEVAVADVDVAWCEFDPKRIEVELKRMGQPSEVSLDFPFYRGPLDQVPVLKTEPYSFAARSRGQLQQFGTLFLARDNAFETCMEYRGMSNNGRYVFKLAEEHKGHDYYEGASGAPIAGPDGTIISMVLGGNDRTHVIYGLELSRFTPLLGLDETDSSQQA
jgi:hypothetical protein